LSAWSAGSRARALGGFGGKNAVCDTGDLSACSDSAPACRRVEGGKVKKLERSEKGGGGELNPKSVTARKTLALARWGCCL